MYNFGLPIPKMENFGYFSAMTDAKLEAQCLKHTSILAKSSRTHK